MVVVAVKVPSGRTAAPSAGTSANSSGEANALESSRIPVAHSEPAADSGPTDPDRVTLSPAATDLGLTRTASGGVVGAARTTRVAETPRFAPPQRPVMV
jgi:hypothetical protein